MKQTYVEVAVNVPLISGIFHYHLPRELEGIIRSGHLVLAPFGPQTVQGVVIGFTEQPSVAETRAIIELVDPEISLTDHQITLAQELAKECLAPLAACIGLMLPPGVDQQADLLYEALSLRPEVLSRTQERLIKLLSRRGPLRGQQIDHAMRRVDWRPAARSLIRRGFLRTERVLPAPSVRPKVVRTAGLSRSPEQIELEMANLGRVGSSAQARRRIILDYLIREGGEVDTSWLYAQSGGNIQDLKFLEQRGLIKLGQSETWRDPLEREDYPLYEAPDLTSDQSRVWKEVQACLQEASNGNQVRPILLHGVTGSGKTEIYLRAVQQTLEMGRQAIVLVPEIALTPQTIQRFAGRFPEKAGLYHSGLSNGERYDTWRRARSGELNLVIGPRSALFIPFSRLGLIVVDECHDDSYYQSETAPHFHAREAAIISARLAGAVCLTGSATPDIVSVYESRQGRQLYLRLPARILAHRAAVQAQLERLNRLGVTTERSKSQYRALEGQAETIDLPPVTIVDMREELKAGNRSIFSDKLQSRLKEVLEHGEQAILFLNRRGSATYVFCRDCGYVLRCPQCEIPLTYHETDNALICHYCNYRRRLPEVCPECGGRRIRQYGTGTQKVEADLHSLFPHIRTLRWDHETTRKKGAHAAILRQFTAHQADVLIGTQMLAKGMDLPLVTLVGVVLAEVGLNLPDYRAGERTFQVLTQVAGRAGRSILGGEVILQTFQPDHYVIRSAASHDFQGFYDQELSFRRLVDYPPYGKLVRLEYRSYDEQKAEQACELLAGQIQNWIQQAGSRATRVIGSAPCFFSRIRGMYRWQIVLCGPDPAALLQGRILPEWKIEVNPPNLL